MTTGIVQEIFSGIQGEGVLVGCRQIFIRLHGCHLACRYCDTPASRQAPPAHCAVERDAGLRVLEALPNPLSAAAMCAAAMRLQRECAHHSVSLTGGEPLLQGALLDALLPRLHDAGLLSYLETNGRLPTALDALAVTPHYIAMDIKLPTTAGLDAAWDDHDAFLAIALARLTAAWGDDAVPARLQVKLVFGEESGADLDAAAALIAARRADVPCILQPVTPRPGGPTAPGPATVLAAQCRLARQLTTVRVIPQTHVMLGQW